LRIVARTSQLDIDKKGRSPLPDDSDLKVARTGSVANSVRIDEAGRDRMAQLRSGCDAERAIDELRLANKSAFGSHRICLLRTMFMASYPAIVLSTPSIDRRH
jgi:hypothetical protein